MNKHDRMYQQIEEHGKNLINLFYLPETTDPIKLAKQVMKLERKAHHAATCLLNTNTLNLLELNKFTGYDVKQATEDEIDAFFGKILKSLDKILDYEMHNIPVFINFDARGYALKIKSEYVADFKIHKDFGGYGVLAPEFDGN